MMTSRRTVFLAAAALAVTFPAWADDRHAGRDPLEGRWLLNVEKSEFRGTPGPRGQLRTYELTDDGVEKMTAKGVSAEKKPTLVRYEARYDGQDYEMTGSLGGDRVSLRRIDALTTESTQKRDGKPTIVAVRKVSPDGKTLTVTSKGRTPSGRIVDAVQIFERY
jgi:hypothetical protein